ncbi:hypothetical protein BC831DRAFT_515910 [Entophlyctis helioformis]|nr:hypothetical protein BC831DRAFT_515910 [Entophlyctis helioformis]
MGMSELLGQMLGDNPDKKGAEKNPLLGLALLGLLTALMYMVGQITLRFVNRDVTLRRKMPTLAAEDAEALSYIHSQTLYVEFPLLARTAFELALLKACAIPALSGLASPAKTTTGGSKAGSKTGGKSGKTLAGESDVDGKHVVASLDLLLREMTERPLTSERAMDAVRRANHLRAVYGVANKEMVYLLTLLMVEPMRLIKAHGFRPLLEREAQVHYMFLSQLAERMGLTDVPATLGDAETYLEDYEAKYMKPAPTNKPAADATIGAILSTYTGVSRPLLRQYIYALCSPRQRAALAMPDPSPLASRLLQLTFRSLAFASMYLLAPRFQTNHRTAALPVPADSKTKTAGRFVPRYVAYDARAYVDGYASVAEIAPTPRAADGKLGKIYGVDETVAVAAPAAAAAISA